MTPQGFDETDNDPPIHTPDSLNSRFRACMLLFAPLGHCRGRTALLSIPMGALRPCSLQNLQNHQTNYSLPYATLIPVPG